MLSTPSCRLFFAVRKRAAIVLLGTPGRQCRSGRAAERRTQRFEIIDVSVIAGKRDFFRFRRGSRAMREDVIGRANVEDTPELDAYYAALGREQGDALWTVANTIEPWHPQPASLPTLGSYAALRPLVMQA